MRTVRDAFMTLRPVSVARRTDSPQVLHYTKVVVMQQRSSLPYVVLSLLCPVVHVECISRESRNGWLKKEIVLIQFSKMNWGRIIKRKKKRSTPLGLFVHAGICKGSILISFFFFLPHSLRFFVCPSEFKQLAFLFIFLPWLLPSAEHVTESWTRMDREKEVNGFNGTVRG